MNANIQLDAGETGCGELIMLIFQTMKPMAPGGAPAVVLLAQGAASLSY